MFNQKVYLKKWARLHKKHLQEYAKKYYKIHQEKKKAYANEYYKKHKKVRKIKNKVRYQTLKWKIWKKNCRELPKNKMYMKKYFRSYRRIPKVKMKRKLWWKTPKGRAYRKLYNTKYRYMIKSLTLNIIQQVYEDNIKKHGTLTCYLCLKPIPFGKDHLEHKTPLSRGGTNKRENLDVACQQCNCSKHNKTEREYKIEML